MTQAPSHDAEGDANEAESADADLDGAESQLESSGGPSDVGSSGGPARTISIVVGVTLVALIALLAFAGSGDDDERTSLLLQRTPEVAGIALDGRSFDIDNHRGSWVLVNFFATWCPGCVNEHDDLVELERWGGETGDLQLVSVVFNDPVDRVDEFFAQRGGTWPVLNSPSVPVDFQVAQIPETFLVSPAGQVVLHVQGEVSAPDLIRFIENAS